MIKMRTSAQILTILLFFFTFTIVGYGQDIRAGNTAKYVGDGHYDWTVYIDADPDILNNIKYVQYTLHPTFKNPVRKVKKRGGDYPFALSMNGWDEFTIGVKVVFRDGTSTSFDYELKLFNRSRRSRRR